MCLPCDRLQGVVDLAAQGKDVLVTYEKTWIGQEEEEGAKEEDTDVVSKDGNLKYLLDANSRIRLTFAPGARVLCLAIALVHNVAMVPMFDIAEQVRRFTHARTCTLAVLDRERERVCVCVCVGV